MADHRSMLRNVKMVFVFGNLELGGGERRGLLLADYLKRECGAEVRVMGLDSEPGRVSELCEELGIQWSGVPFHWGLRRRIPSLLRATAALKRMQPDVLIPYTRVPNMVCAFGWKIAGAKLCIWNQSDEGLLMSRMPHYRLAMTRPQCFISNSTGGKEFLVRTYGMASERIQVIHNGVALKEAQKDRTRWRTDLEIDPQAAVVCMVANLSVYKDHRTLLKAWKEVLDRGQFQVLPVLVLGGRFDGEEAALQQMAAELGIAASVRFPGKIEDVAGLLQSADLFAFSSRSEGIPNAVLEAMASGLPVVGTDIPGIREAVGPQGVPYLSAVGDASAFAERMLSLLQDEAARNELGRTLRQRAREEFSIDAMCVESAQLICDCLSRVNT